MFTSINVRIWKYIYIYTTLICPHIFIYRNKIMNKIYSDDYFYMLNVNRKKIYNSYIFVTFVPSVVGDENYFSLLVTA